MTSFQAPLPDFAKPGDQGISDDVNKLVAAIAEIRDAIGTDAVTRSDLTDLSSSVQEDLSQTLGVVTANDAGAFPADLPATDRRLWVGRDSSDYSRASVRDLRVRVADAEWA